MSSRGSKLWAAGLAAVASLFALLGGWLLVIYALDRTIAGLDASAGLAIATLSIAVAIFLVEFNIAHVSIRAMSEKLVKGFEDIQRDLAEARSQRERIINILASRRRNRN